MNNTFVNITGAHSSLGSWGNSRNITWVGNTMNNVENYGFSLYGSEDSIIINNSFYKVADSILAGGENITITGNVMDDRNDEAVRLSIDWDINDTTEL